MSDHTPKDIVSAHGCKKIAVGNKAAAQAAVMGVNIEELMRKGVKQRHKDPNKFYVQYRRVRAMILLNPADLGDCDALVLTVYPRGDFVGPDTPARPRQVKQLASKHSWRAEEDGGPVNPYV